MLSSFNQDMKSAHLLRQNSKALSLSLGSMVEEMSELIASCFRHLKPNPQAINAAQKS